MNQVSIIINGTRYDATDMHQWTNCGQCDLYDICTAEHYWLREACTELGDHKGIIVFKKTIKTLNHDN